MIGIKKATLVVLTLLIAACSSITPSETAKKPEIVPAVMIKKTSTYQLGTIGGVEPVYILPMKSPFAARIDTGAEGSSLDAKNIKTFERDGEKWVSFVITNRETGETKKFEKELVHETTIKRIGNDERRYVVKLDIKMGKQIVSTSVSLANREKFEYQALIGRNILAGRALVDPALSNTLY